MTDHQALARGVALVSELKAIFQCSRPSGLGLRQQETTIAALEAAERVAKPAIPEGIDAVERGVVPLGGIPSGPLPTDEDWDHAALAAIKPEKEGE